MHGEISVRVHNARVCYEFTLRRNITVLFDEGATGKTSLIRMLSEYIPGGGTGIFVNVSTGVPLTVLNYQVWRVMTDNEKNIKAVRSPQIFLVDEDEPFFTSGDFADFVWGSGCYFLLIIRDNLTKLSSLTCSAKEMYRLHTENRRTTFVPIYSRTRYGKLPKGQLQFITEDSQFGKKFFSKVYGEHQVISACGKDNILNILDVCEFEHPIVIADGAAFGFNMRQVLAKVEDLQGLLIVEESFEYMLLTSGIFSRYEQQLKDELKQLNCLKYTTWERFFTAFIETITRDTQLVYKKDGFNMAYLEPSNRTAILERYELPEVDEYVEQTNIF